MQPQHWGLGKSTLPKMFPKHQHWRLRRRRRRRRLHYYLLALRRTYFCAPLLPTVMVSTFSSAPLSKHPTREGRSARILCFCFGPIWACQGRLAWGRVHRCGRGPGRRHEQDHNHDISRFPAAKITGKSTYNYRKIQLKVQEIRPKIKENSIQNYRKSDPKLKEIHISCNFGSDFL